MKARYITLLALSALSAASSALAAEGEGSLGGTYIAKIYGCDPATEPSDRMTTCELKRVIPRHCAKMKTTTPVFVASLPDSADLKHEMTLTLYRPDTATPSRIKFDGPRMILPHAEALAKKGKYEWEITYYNTAGAERITERRAFFFESAELPPMPATAEVVRNVIGHENRDGSHPRIIPRVGGVRLTGDELLSRIRAAGMSESIDKYMEEAHAYLPVEGKADPVTEPPAGVDARYPADDQAEAVEKLLMTAYLKGTSGADYRNEAKRRLLKLAQWSTEPAGTSSEWISDQANRAVYLTLALGLDMLDAPGNLTDEEKKKLLVALKARLGASVLRADYGLPKPGGSPMASLSASPYDSHGLAGAQYAATATMLATGISVGDVKFEDGPTGTMLEKAWVRSVTSLGAWAGDEDSAFGNGTYYGWMSLISTSRALASYLIMSDVNLTQYHPALHWYGDNAQAFTPRATAQFRSPFGDGADDKRVYTNYAADFFGLFALLSGRNSDAWYHADATAAQAKEKSLPYQLYFVRALTAPVQPKAPEKKDYLFEAAGTVAMHSDATELDRSSVYFRSSALGTYNHSHADNNAFAMVSRGRDVFISGGYYDAFDSTIHQYFTRPTRFKNAVTYCDALVKDEQTGALTCAGFGQAEPDIYATSPGAPKHDLKSAGRLVNYYENPNGWSVVTGDATKAYGRYDATKKEWAPALTRAIRTVAYNRVKGLVYIYDSLESDIPRHWQFNFQTHVQPTALKGTRLAIDNVCMRFHGPAGSYHTEDWNALSGAPISKAGQQYHTSYTTTLKTTGSSSVTVIAENCGDIEYAIATYASDSSKRWTVTFPGSTVTFDKGVVTVVE